MFNFFQDHTITALLSTMKQKVFKIIIQQLSIIPMNKEKISYQHLRLT